MIQVSNEALANLSRLLASEGFGDNSAIRIAVVGGSSGPGLGLIVDEATEEDLCFQQGDIPLIVDRRLLAYCQNIRIEFTTGDQGGGCAGKSGGGYLLTADNPINF